MAIKMKGIDVSKHQGEIDWKKLFALLKERGYSGYYTLEPSYRHYIDDIDTALRRDYEYISSLV